MSDKRPPYHRRTTKPLPRAHLAPIGPAPEVDNKAPTMTLCPYCEPYGARGLVPPEVRAAWHRSAVVSDRELRVIDEPDDEPPEAA